MEEIRIKQQLNGASRQTAHRDISDHPAMYNSSTMSNYITTVIKVGNSYALQIPKKYVEDAKLVLGQKVVLQLPTATSDDQKQDRKRIQFLVRQLQEIGAYKDIKDPVAWQREIRKDRPLPGRE